jgi:hypothetical protein
MEIWQLKLALQLYIHFFSHDTEHLNYSLNFQGALSPVQSHFTKFSLIKLSLFQGWDLVQQKKQSLLDETIPDCIVRLVNLINFKHRVIYYTFP